MFKTIQELRQDFFDHVHKCEHCSHHMKHLCAAGYCLLRAAIQRFLPHEPEFEKPADPVLSSNPGSKIRRRGVHSPRRYKNTARYTTGES